MPTPKPFRENLREKIDVFVHMVFESSKTFPKQEQFGVTSQLRRAAISVALNYIEGYARQRNNSNRHFLEISYGSLKETGYLIGFCFREGWIDEQRHNALSNLCNELGAMIWSTTQYKKQPQ